MFGKKTCKRCGKKAEKKFGYCPHCGTEFAGNTEKDIKDFGMLGKDDNLGMKMPFGFNFLFKNLMKEMDKQFRAMDKEMEEKGKTPKKAQFPLSDSGRISINISSGNRTPVIRVRSFGNLPGFKNLESELKKEKIERVNKTKSEMNKIDDNRAQQISKLPRQEADSKVRRLSGRVIYEIELPGVDNLKNVIVNELENSIEIKAFAKDKAYFKFLPVRLPVLQYSLKDNKLVLELGEK